MELAWTASRMRVSSEESLMSGVVDLGRCV